MHLCQKISCILVGPALLFCACSGRSSSLNNSGAVAALPDKKVEVVEFNGDSAYARVADQVAMGPRVPGSEANARLGRYIIDRLKNYGADTVIEPLVRWPGRQLR